jgi:hypothetical protein
MTTAALPSVHTEINVLLQLGCCKQVRGSWQQHIGPNNWLACPDSDRAAQKLPLRLKSTTRFFVTTLVG